MPVPKSVSRSEQPHVAEEDWGEWGGDSYIICEESSPVRSPDSLHSSRTARNEKAARRVSEIRVAHADRQPGGLRQRRNTGENGHVSDPSSVLGAGLGWIKMNAYKEPARSPLRKRHTDLDV
jgi:hypothetical protein